jgi:hypothetical protein
MNGLISESVAAEDVRFVGVTVMDAHYACVTVAVSVSAARWNAGMAIMRYRESERPCG